MIAATAHALSRLAGWRRLAAAFAAGALTIFAFAPYFLIPVLWLAFPALMWLLDGCKTWRAAALTGWAFGFGYFLTGFFWITNAFFVDSETFGAVAYPAVTALAAGVGLFAALACAATHCISPPGEDDMPDDRVVTTVLRSLLFAAVWTGLEWVRSWIFTGFPWNPIAAVWAETATPIGPAVIQVTAMIGTYGLTLVTLVAAFAPAGLAQPPRFRRAWLMAAGSLLLLVVAGGGGAVRLALAETQFVAGVKLRLVQAGIPQIERARPSLWESQLQDYVALSVTDRPADVTHVIWGEAAVPPTFFLNLDERHRRAAALAAPPGGLLITGADRGVHDGTRWTAIYNSLFVITPEASIVAGYDKTHLVPFGEYMPMRRFIPFEKITGGIGDFAAGTGLTTIAISGLPAFTPLICYEAIFSGDVTPDGGVLNRGRRPEWLLNLTNDAWFGLNTGPYQHLATARLRAVEEGLPLVRAANTGVSAVIDGYGRTVAALGLGMRGVVDSRLPLDIGYITPFGWFGNAIPLFLATILAGVAFFIQRRRQQRTQRPLWPTGMDGHIN